MTILVLEDAIERVQWLRRNTTAVVTHVATVADFTKALATADAKLIILDHDLGSHQQDSSRPFEVDVDGLTGADAARRIPDNFSGIVLVWSWNVDGAADIEQYLSGRNVPCIRKTFHPGTALAELIDIAVR